MRHTVLQELENASVEILREVVAQFKNPVLLYSIGKDSGTLLHLASKAFFPGRIPFPIMHIDSTFEFRETIDFRNRVQQFYNVELIVYKNEQGIRDGINPFDHGSSFYTDVMRTTPLKDAIAKFGFDGIIGGARRDEEKSRAKERIFSVRSESQGWDPKSQRPELWNLYNGQLQTGQTMRVFPISNWTELDVWQYIRQEQIPLPSVYFSKKRPVIIRDGQLICVDDDRMRLRDGETVEQKNVRFRTCGCYPLTGGILSDAETVDDIIEELFSSGSSERQGRLIDHDGASAMEDKKKQGYF